jgi:hypothetical protein
MSDFEFRFKNEIINLINRKLEVFPIEQQSEEQKEVLPGLESVYITTPDGLVYEI